MKKLKKIVSMLVAVAICVLLPTANTLTVSAEEPVTYYVKYIDNDSEWRFQKTSQWDRQVQHRELYYMYQDIKDGDIIIVDGVDISSPIEVSVRLSNLTFLHGASAIVKAQSIDNCFVLRDTVVSINGDVTNASVYDNARCTFNNNVGTLQILNDAIVDEALLHGTVSVGGTVNHLIGKDNTQVHYELYNFAAGKLVIESGSLKTDDDFYSSTASATDTTTAEQTTTQTTQTAPSDESNDEYDDVPETGDNNLVFWLLGISAICFAGRYALKKA